ncbi:hypothetical protein [Radiobacillus sp. PE A8.2]|uniref:hypothetical protein n=1 Tax=Radiobacillus sp. PE A8.2 TaxID=3380349 RepID=UPI00388EDAEE
MKLYWGDLHNHCGISYGFGSLDNALIAAKKQLDFVCIIGHAAWHDIPDRTEKLEFLVDFHEKGFNKLQENWNGVREKVKESNIPHEFVTFQGYEAHSSEYGDHHIISKDDDLPLIQEKSPYDIMKALQNYDVFAIPHHVGYTPGYRGGNWDTFDEQISPVIEVFSKHGSGMSEDALYPYYHDMGPRDSKSTVFEALRRGHKFGFVGSTDHHAGYPGSYGDGRLAVLANQKTRDDIWEALRERRTYAVTGDKIECDFRVNDSLMGSEIRASGNRNIKFSVKGEDFLEKIILYKNLKPMVVVNGEDLDVAKSKTSKYKLRIEMGWGNAKEGFVWKSKAEISNGKILKAEPCFRGRSVLAPTPEMKEDPDMNALQNEMYNVTDQVVEWDATTFKNPTTLHPHTSAMILEVEGDEETVVKTTINGVKVETKIKDIRDKNITRHLEEYNSEAFVIHKAVPEEAYTFVGEWNDEQKENDIDIYHMEVRQKNQQMAWISPVFVKAE